MEFLVHIEVRWPTERDPQDQDGLNAAERRRAAELANTGNIKRLWRIPGRTANWGIWEAPDATRLHELLSSLPLIEYLDIEVHPLARHPSDPAGGTG